MKRLLGLLLLFPALAFGQPSSGSVRITDGVENATVRDTGVSDSLNVAVTDAAGNQLSSFPVTQSGTWDEVGINDSGNLISIDDGGGVITVDGALTCNAGTNLNTALLALESGGNLASIAAEDFATQTTLSALNAKLVSGTDIGDVTINNASGASAVNIQDGGNSITIDGTVAATQSGAWSNRITDGTDTAEVLNLAANDPLSVAIVDASGAQITSFGGGSGGTEYTEGDTDATITGPAVMMEVAANTLQPIQGTIASGLLVNLGTNNDVTVTGSVDVTDSFALDASVDGIEGLLSTSNTNTGSAATSLAALDNAVAGNELQVDVLTMPTVTITDGAGALNVIVDSGSITANAGTNLNTSALALETSVDGIEALLGTSNTNTGNSATSLTLIDDAVIADDAAFTPATTKLFMAGFEFDDTTPDSVNEGDAGAVRMSANRNLYSTIRDAAGNERGVNVTAGNALTVDGSGVTQPVSAASLPLPAGAATSANQTTIIGHIDGVEALLTTIDADTGSILTSVQLTDDLVTTEDQASANLDEGTVLLARRTAAPANTSGTDLDYEALQLSAGRLWTSTTIDSALPAGTNNIGDVDIVSLPNEGQQTMANSVSVAFASDQSALPISGTVSVTEPVSVDDNGGSLTVDAPVGTPANVQIGDASETATVRDTGASDSLNVAIVDGSGNQVTSFGGGTQYTEDVASAADPIGAQLIARRRDALSTETTTDGDNTAVNTTGKGELYVKHTDAITVNAGTNLNTSALALESSVDGIEALLGTSNTNTGNAATSLAALDNAVAGNEFQVDVLTMPTVTVTDGAGALNVIIDSGTTAVTNAGTFLVQENGALLTSSQLIDDLVTAEDQASANLDEGIVLFARRTATPANTSGADLDYEALQMAAGRLYTSSTIDAALPAGTNNIGDIDVLTLPSVTIGTFPDNEPFNVAQINGVTPLMGAGATGTGSPRVTAASNSPEVTALEIIDNIVSGSGVNVSQINGVAPSMGNGVSGTGVPRVTIASDSTGIIGVTQSGTWDEVGINDSGNSITVDGTVAATQSGTWTSRITDGTDTAQVFDLAANDPLSVAIVDGAGAQITSFGGGTQYTEDAAAAADPVGTTPILVRQDSPATVTSTNGDNIAQRGTNYGAAYAQIITSAGAFVDTFGGGSQYTEGDTDATITGTATMMEVAANTLQPIQGTVADGLLVNLGANNDVTVTGSVTANAGTNLNTSALALQTAVDGVEGLLTTIDADTGTISTEISSLDGKFTSAAALGDDDPNPTTTRVGAALQLWDGIVWDRAPGNTVSGLLVNLGPNNDVTITGTVPVTQSGTWDEVGINDSGNSITVDDGASSLTIDGTIAATQSGTWILGVNSGVDIGDVTINNAAGASAVNIQDGGNSLTIDGAVTISSGSVTADTELAAAAALADATANPTIPLVGSLQEIYNGVTWDRIRSIINATNTTGTGVLGVGLIAQLDDTSPTAITENQFGNLRMSSRRALLIEGVAGGIPIPITDPKTTTMTEVTGAVGTASSVILASNANRVGGYILNSSANIIWIRHNGTAATTATPSTRIVAGGMYDLTTGGVCYTGAITAISTVASSVAVVTSP